MRKSHTKTRYSAVERITYAKNIASFKAEGKSYIEIAEATGINYNTVRHWGLAYAKKNIAQLIGKSKKNPALAVVKSPDGLQSFTAKEINAMPMPVIEKVFPLNSRPSRRYTQNERDAISARRAELIDMGISHTKATQIAGVARKSFYSWVASGYVKTDTSALESTRVGAQLEITPEPAPVISKSETAAPYTPDTRLSAPAPIVSPAYLATLTDLTSELAAETGRAVTALEHRLAQNATTQHVAALTERVQYLEHAAQDAHQALYDARERLLALEASDTEPTPFHAVDRTYVIVIAIMVVTVAITLVTVLL
jgi:hypothetical protein